MIDRFDNNYRFLSNFWTIAITFEGLSFPSVEHAYVAAKTLDQNERVRICHIGTAREVKAYGQKLQLRPDWDQVKLKIMEDLVRQKFSKNIILRDALVATGTQEIVEGNYQGDKYWGIDLKTGEGENHLGKIIMKVRDELR